MRIGISLSSRQPVDDVRRGAQNMVDRARAARDAGLDSLTIGDHHAMASPYYQNTPMLGRLIGEWPSDRQVGCLFLVPLWHPVLMAEHIGTLASLSDARFVVQTGIGGGDEQFAALAADLRTRGRIAEERIARVQALLAGSDPEGVTIAPTPPDPVEWWIGAGSRPGIDRAARLGTCWYAGPDLTLSRAIELLALYRERCDAHGSAPSRLPIRKDVIVGPSDAATRELGDELIARGYRGFSPGAAVYGSPERVAEELAPYAEAGFTDVIVRTMTVPQEVAMQTISLLGEIEV